MSASIILASGSPRRRELLDQIGVSYRVQAADIDETPLPGEAAQTYVQRIAAAKSECIRRLNPENELVLAADTSVVLAGTIMGKPVDRDDAIAMLSQLSGRSHRVYSAVSLRGAQHWQALNITEVRFRTLTQQEIEAYWRTGEPHDKAGAYAIQGIGGQFVEYIAGSFSGVVGLPLFETSALLAQAGIAILDK